MCDSEKELVEFYIGKLNYVSFNWWSNPSSANKGWQLVEEAKGTADHLIGEHADHIYFNNPENWRSYVKPSTDPAIGAPAAPAVGSGAAPATPPKA